MRRALRFCTALLALFALPEAAAAQGRWTLDLAAGHASYDAVAARIGAGSLMMGARRGEGELGWLYLFGGAPLDTRGISWGAAGAGHRLLILGGPSLSMGADVGLHLLGYRDAVAEVNGGGATLEVLPFVAVGWGGAVLDLRSGLLQHTDQYADERFTRRIHHTGAQLSLAPMAGVRLVGNAQYLRAPEDDYPFVGIGAETVRGPVTAWGSAGRWLHDSIPIPAYGAGVGVRITDRWEIQTAWQQESRHPLYWNLPRRSWSVRLSRALGARPTPAPFPVPSASAVVTRDAEGRMTIRIPTAEAPSAPSILGDFSGWQPVAMRRSGDLWVVKLTLAPGVYRYGFRNAEGQWFMPASVPMQVDDDMGGTSAVLVVP